MAIGAYELPSCWPKAKLGDYLSLIRNGTSKKQNKGGLGLPVSRIETISDDRVDPNKIGYVEGLAEQEVEKYQLQFGDILFSHINSEPQLGRTALYVGKPEPLIHGMNLLLLRTSEKFLVSRFLHLLCAYLRSRGVFIALAGRAVGQSSINQGRLKNLSIPCPPILEQRRIAAVLSLVQRAIEQQERLIALTTELKRALMHKLFTEGTRGEPQKQTEIGPIPESWEVVKLVDIVKFKTGKLNSNAAVENGKYPFFTCSQQDYRIDTYAFDEEAILLSGNNAKAIYSVKYYKGKFNAYQRTYVITISDINHYDYQFLKSALSMNLEKLRTISIGTSTKYLTLGLLQNLLMYCPSIEEQKAIGKSLNIIETAIDIVLAKKLGLQDLFRTLLHQLMSAEIQVNDLDLSDLGIETPTEQPREEAI